MRDGWRRGNDGGEAEWLRTAASYAVEGGGSSDGLGERVFDDICVGYDLCSGWLKWEGENKFTPTFSG
jgi:hypothetical protein